MKAVYFFVLLLTGSVLLAQKPGTLDTSYGHNTGTVTYIEKYALTSVAIQKDNKILTGSTDTDTSATYILARRYPDGSLDSSFGTNGETVTNVEDLRSDTYSSSGWLAMTVAPDGKIITIGIITYYNPKHNGEGFLSDEDVVVARFLPDGMPDNSFGNKGRVVTDLGYLEEVNSVAQQPDGKILVAGTEILDIYGNTDGMLLMRYNSDGTLDRRFGKYHGYTLDDEDRNRATYGYHVQLQSDGKIVEGGTEIGDEAFALLRYLPDGRLDNSFGVNGYVETKLGAIGGGTTMADMALDAKGRILATGQVGSNEGTAVTRYVTSGALDSTFDKDGILQASFANVPLVFTNTLLPQPHNKLVISGYATSRKPGGGGLALMALNEDGSPDVSFGTGRGKTVTDITVYGSLYPSSLMQGDGKIVVVNPEPFSVPYEGIDTVLITRFNGYKQLNTLSSEMTAGKAASPKENVVTSCQLYPNPASDYVLVSGLVANAQTTIFVTNDLGKMIAGYKTNGAAQYRCNVSKLAAGIYYVGIKTAGRSEVLKFVKE